MSDTKKADTIDNDSDADIKSLLARLYAHVQSSAQLTHQEQSTEITGTLSDHDKLQLGMECIKGMFDVIKEFKDPQSIDGRTVEKHLFLPFVHLRRPLASTI